MFFSFSVHVMHSWIYWYTYTCTYHMNHHLGFSIIVSISYLSISSSIDWISIMLSDRYNRTKTNLNCPWTSHDASGTECEQNFTFDRRNFEESIWIFDTISNEMSIFMNIEFRLYAPILEIPLSKVQYEKRRSWVTIHPFRQIVTSDNKNFVRWQLASVSTYPLNSDRI